MLLLYFHVETSEEYGNKKSNLRRMNATAEYSRGGGWERYEVQRTAKRCDHDGHGKLVGFSLLLLSAVVLAARALPPTNEQTWNDKQSTRRSTRSSTDLHCVVPTY